MSATGSSSEPSGVVRPWRRASQPSTWSVAIAAMNSGGRPVRVVREVPDEEDDHERRGDDARDGELVGEAHRFGENTSPVGLFSKVLVANRGEIAIRIFRTLRELGIGSVAVYSEADRGALHVARRRRGASCSARARRPRATSHQERIVETARRAGAEAVHPGYGFLAENADVRARGRGRRARLDRPAAGGDRGDGLEDRGARARCSAAGVPIIPGTTEPVESRRGGRPPRRRARLAARDQGRRRAAAARASRSSAQRDDVERAFESARREGEAYFSDPTVYVERYLEDPRHVEVQVLADAHGNVIHLGERDCTIQRRHQKLVEETPSPAVDAELRARIGAIAVEAARAVGYRSAGTIEGLLDRGRRLLLHGDEHAHPGRAHGHGAGHRPRPRPRAGADRGRRAAIAAPGGRPADAATRSSAGSTPRTRPTASCPTPGRITGYREPAGPGVRVDSGVEDGSEISPLYDPMIAKLIVHGVDREHARRRMLRALDEFEIGGVTTLLGFHRALLSAPVLRRRRDVPRRRRVGAAGGGGASSCRMRQQRVPAASDGRLARARHDRRARRPPLRRQRARARAAAGSSSPSAGAAARPAARHGAGGRDAIVSPMQGTVLSVEVAEGDSVAAGQVICIVEAMKMENEVHAHPRRRRHRAVGRAGRAGAHRPGDLRRRSRRRMAPSVGRSAPRSRCENAEPLAATASRVDHWLLVEYRGLWGRDVLAAQRALRPRSRRASRAGGGPPAHEAALRPPPRAPRPRRARTSSGEARRERGGALFRAELDGYDDLLELDLTAPGRAARPPAAARLHARQARPLLRPVRPAALRGARRARRRRLGLAVARTSAATASPATSSCLPEGLYFGRVGAGGGLARARRVPGRADRPRPLPRPVAPTRSPSRRRSGPCARRPACAGSTTSSSSRHDGRSSCSAPAGASTRSSVTAGAAARSRT